MSRVEKVLLSKQYRLMMQALESSRLSWEVLFACEAHTAALCMGKEYCIKENRTGLMCCSTGNHVGWIWVADKFCLGLAVEISAVSLIPVGNTVPASSRQRSSVHHVRVPVSPGAVL